MYTQWFEHLRPHKYCQSKYIRTTKIMRRIILSFEAVFLVTRAQKMTIDRRCFGLKIPPFY